MYKKRKILAIIPARHGSKGLPGKNWKIINNKPLIFWTIKAAQRSKYIDDIILTTDSNIVIKIANKMGLNNFIKRPGYLSLDSTKSSEVILHTLKNVALKKSIYDYFIFLEPTSPLRTYIDIDKSISKLCSSKATCLLSVAKNVNQSPEFLYTINKNFYLKNYLKKTTHVRRQDIKEQTYFIDGSIYISCIKTFLKTRSLFNQIKTIPIIMNKIKSFEIDDITDFKIIETFFKKK